MAPTFYQIELSSRLLTVLLVVLALLMVMAFAFGYGAAWSVFEHRPSATVEPAGPPVLGTSTATAVARATSAPSTPVATATRRPSATATATKAPTRTPLPIRPTSTPRPRVRPTAVVGSGAYWVQVLAVSHRQSINEMQQRLENLGFPRSNQALVEASTVGGVLYKLRYGPLPDKGSADRVVARMKEGGLADAFVVVE